MAGFDPDQAGFGQTRAGWQASTRFRPVLVKTMFVLPGFSDSANIRQMSTKAKAASATLELVSTKIKPSSTKRRCSRPSLGRPLGRRLPKRNWCRLLSASFSTSTGPVSNKSPSQVGELCACHAPRTKTPKEDGGGSDEIAERSSDTTLRRTGHWTEATQIHRHHSAAPFGAISEKVPLDCGQTRANLTNNWSRFVQIWPILMTELGSSGTLSGRTWPILGQDLADGV